jgi:excisionase family DNA binding protein
MHQLDRAQTLAEFLAVSVAAVRKWTRTTDMPRVKIGRAVRYDRSAVLAWLAARGTRKNGKGKEGGEEAVSDARGT